MSAAVTHLALRVADEARVLGFTYDGLTASRCPVSASRYLYLRDRSGRRWLIRVSDHAARRRRAVSIPHYDLVARPAEADQALEAASVWLASVAAGLVAWHDPEVRRQDRRRP